MGKSQQLNEDIKNISKLMGYDRGLTSVENNLLFEQKQLNEEQSTIIPFENYDDISISWDEDENGNPIISDYQGLLGIANGLEDATDAPIDDEDLNDVYNAVTFLTGKYTDEGQAACEKVLEIFADKTGNEDLGGEVASAGSNSLGGFGFGVIWSDDDDMELKGKAMTFGNAKKVIQKAIKGCSAGSMTSSTEKGQGELEETWPAQYRCILTDGGTYIKTKKGTTLYIVSVNDKMAKDSKGNLNTRDKLAYYPDGNMRVFPRGEMDLAKSKGPFPYNCGNTEDIEFESETTVQTESRKRMNYRYKLLQEWWSNIGDVFIDFEKDIEDKKKEDEEGGVGTEKEVEVIKKKGGTKYRKVTYTFDDIVDGTAEAKLGDVNRDEDGAIWKVQELIGAKTDGVFGPNTKKAVMSYQRRKKLDVDGVFAQEEAGIQAPGGVGTEAEAENPNAETVSTDVVQDAKIKITDDSSATEVINHLKDLDEKQFSEGECVDLVVAAHQALPNKEEAIMPQLQACFFNYNFPSLRKERRAVKKRYGITGKGRRK